MDNNNYNTNLKTVYDHMQLSQDDRQKHIDLATPCWGYEIQIGRRKGQWSNQGGHAKKSLLDFHQIEDFKSYKIHTCHLCPNDSSKPNGFVCINPHHLYFGTHSENQLDKPEELRKKGGKRGGKAPSSDKQKKFASKNATEMQKKLFEEGRHQSQKLHTCTHCGFEGKGPIMKRWHFDNCKHR